MLTAAERKRIKAQTALAVRDCGGQETCAEVSDRVNRHQSFSEFASQAQRDRFMPIDVAAELDRFAPRPRFAELLAQLAGGVFIPLPRGSGPWAIEAAAGTSTKEFGDVMIKLGEALRDGKLDARERHAVIKEIDEALTGLVNLRQSIAAEGAGEGE